MDWFKFLLGAFHFIGLILILAIVVATMTVIEEAGYRRCANHVENMCGMKNCSAPDKIGLSVECAEKSYVVDRLEILKAI